MYDRGKAEVYGYLVTCEAPLLRPVTSSGAYPCQEGHLHRVG